MKGESRVLSTIHVNADLVWPVEHAQFCLELRLSVFKSIFYSCYLGTFKASDMASDE